MTYQNASEEELAFLADAGHGAAANEKRDSLLDHQLTTSPLVTFSAFEQHPHAFPSRALLGTAGGERIYLNTNAPSSGVVCGVQGAGKSHTVSCILESALIPDGRIGQLPKPLAALVCHFNEEGAGGPCEAAYLSQRSTKQSFSSNTVLPKVTILCSPSNFNRRRRDYASLRNVQVYPLYLSEQDLTASRMLAIMGCDSMETMPLYLHSTLAIIRNMGSDSFSYTEFRRRIDQAELNDSQRAMIKLRLDLLDAFLRPGSTELKSYFGAGQMVLVDLTDPFLDGVTAAILFDIALGSFMQWETGTGKLFVLDEAHKVLTSSDAARLTRSIASVIRQQRHLATRVVIATQEPTVVPQTVLDLASFIMCHRFSSPAWCRHLAGHVSAGSDDWLDDVMLLETGEALVFSAASLVSVPGEKRGTKLLGRDFLRVRVRPRLTSDGGASIMAVSSTLGTMPLTPAGSPLDTPDTSAHNFMLPNSQVNGSTHPGRPVASLAAPRPNSSLGHTSPRMSNIAAASPLRFTSSSSLPSDARLPASTSFAPGLYDSASRSSSPLSPPASQYSTPAASHAALPSSLLRVLSAAGSQYSSSPAGISSRLSTPHSAPSALPSSDTPVVTPTPLPSVANNSSRFNALVAFLREQKALGIHEVSWSTVGGGVPSRLSVDGEQLKVKAFLEEAEQEGLVRVSGAGETGAVSLARASAAQLPAVPVMPSQPTPLPSRAVPPTSVFNSAFTSTSTGFSASIPSATLLSPRPQTASTLPPPTFAAPVPAPPPPPATTSATKSQPSHPRFDPLIRYLREQQAQGYPQVNWSSVGTHVKMRVGVDGSVLRLKVFLAEAEAEGVVSMGGRPEDNTDWVKLLRAESTWEAPASSAPPASKPNDTSFAAPSSQPYNFSSATRFQPLIAYLKRQRADGVDQVACEAVKLNVPELRGRSGGQVGLTSFLTEAEEEGLINIGGTVFSAWVSLRSSPNAASSDLGGTTSLPMTQQVPHTSAPTPGPSSHSTPTSTVKNVPGELKVFIEMLQEKRSEGLHQVTFTQAGTGLNAKMNVSGKGKGRLTGLVALAKAHGLIITGSSYPGGDWITLKGNFAYRFSNVPAVKSAKAVPIRFKPLVEILQARHAAGQTTVLWTQLGAPLQHLRTSNSWFKSFITDAVSAQVVQIGKTPDTGMEWAKLILKSPFVYA